MKKCNFCDSKNTELKKMDVLISTDLKSDKREFITVDLCNKCISRIKGE